MKSHAKSCTQEPKKEVDAEKRMCYPVQLDNLKVWMSGYLISGGLVGEDMLSALNESVTHFCICIYTYICVFI